MCQCGICGIEICGNVVRMLFKFTVLCSLFGPVILSSNRRKSLRVFRRVVSFCDVSDFYKKKNNQLTEKRVCVVLEFRLRLVQDDV